MSVIYPACGCGSWQVGHTVARILDGDGLEVLIERLGVLAVPEVVGFGKRERRGSHPDQGDVGEGHDNDCHSGRRREVRKMHR